MFFQKFKTPGIAHLAYLIADQKQAVLVDPRRDVDEYLAVARENELTIAYVLETHRQEDFVIGSRRVKELTGAKIVSGDHELFGHSDLRLRDGERLELGALSLEARHTPGHTPESTCYALYVEAAPAVALGVFTGDTLFIGETGRTDLTDRERTSEHAGQLYDAVHRKLLPLGDQTIIWPGHGAGSVCGGKIADRDESTLGLERTYNPVFRETRDAFIQAKLRERIPRPPYFRHMERVNLEGGLGPGTALAAIPLLDAERFTSQVQGALVIDAREPEAFAGAHIPGAINVWLGGLPVFGGWLAREDTPILLVLPDAADLNVAVTHLARVGLDRVAGVLRGGFASWRNAGLPLASSGALGARQLERQLDRITVLDVRDDAEFEEDGHIPGAHHLYVGYLPEHLERIEGALRERRDIAVTCSVGHRAGIAVSLLEQRGITHVANLLGGMTAWQELELPTQKGRQQSITTPEIEGARK